MSIIVESIINLYLTVKKTKLFFPEKILYKLRKFEKRRKFKIVQTVKDLKTFCKVGLKFYEGWIFLKYLAKPQKYLRISNLYIVIRLYIM